MKRMYVFLVVAVFVVCACGGEDKDIEKLLPTTLETLRGTWVIHNVPYNQGSGSWTTNSLKLVMDFNTNFNMYRSVDAGVSWTNHLTGSFSVDTGTGVYFNIKKVFDTDSFTWKETNYSIFTGVLVLEGKMGLCFGRGLPGEYLVLEFGKSGSYNAVSPGFAGIGLSGDFKPDTSCSYSIQIKLEFNGNQYLRQDSFMNMYICTNPFNVDIEYLTNTYGGSVVSNAGYWEMLTTLSNGNPVTPYLERWPIEFAFLEDNQTISVVPGFFYKQ